MFNKMAFFWPWLNLETEEQINKLKKDDTVPEKAKLISLLESFLILSGRATGRNANDRKSSQKYRKKMAERRRQKEELRAIIRAMKQIKRENPKSKSFSFQDWCEALASKGIENKKGIMAIYGYVRPYYSASTN